MRYLLGLLVILPVLAIILTNTYRLFAGHGFEPVEDNVIVSILTFVILIPAALACGFRYKFAKISVPTLVDLSLYGGTAAIGSCALLTIADYADDYFTPGGVGWEWPLSGFIAGLVFGLLFRLLVSLAALQQHSAQGLESSAALGRDA